MRWKKVDGFDVADDTAGVDGIRVEVVRPGKVEWKVSDEIQPY